MIVDLSYHISAREGNASFWQDLSFLARMADTPPGKAPDTARAQLIRQAQTFIAQNSAQTVDFAALAARLGLPYRMRHRARG